MTGTTQAAPTSDFAISSGGAVSVARGSSATTTITIKTARPGLVIGPKGAEVDKLRDELAQLTGKEVGINVEEIPQPHRLAERGW